MPELVEYGELDQVAHGWPTLRSSRCEVCQQGLERLDKPDGEGRPTRKEPAQAPAARARGPDHSPRQIWSPWGGSRSIVRWWKQSRDKNLWWIVAIPIGFQKCAPEVEFAIAHTWHLYAPPTGPPVTDIRAWLMTLALWTLTQAVAHAFSAAIDYFL